MSKRISAAELIAKLNSDPEFVARRTTEEAEREKRDAEYARAEAPLVQELRAAGRAVDSAWDLVNTPGTYPELIPILLAHVARPYPAAVREGIARALAVRESSCGWSLLSQLYRQESVERVKDGLAVALAAASNDELLGDLIALVRDRANGPSRLLLLRALDRTKDPRGKETLIHLSQDPDLEKEIEVILRRRSKRSGKQPHRGPIH
jgi:hypothetical protein